MDDEAVLVDEPLPHERPRELRAAMGQQITALLGLQSRDLGVQLAGSDLEPGQTEAMSS